MPAACSTSVRLLARIALFQSAEGGPEPPRRTIAAGSVSGKPPAFEAGFTRSIRVPASIATLDDLWHLAANLG